MPTTPSLAAQMPKQEIGAVAFMRAHPEYDGRGVLVAVLDTGVDPGAKGLQVCPDGRRKMVDVCDCTGAGDVDTSSAAAAEADGTLKGLSGRTLRLPATWPPLKPGAKYQLGVKHAFELYPRGLAARVKEERRKPHDASQRDAVATCQAALLEKPPNPDKKWEHELKTRASQLEKLSSRHALEMYTRRP